MPEQSLQTQIACGAGAAALCSAAFIHPLELVKTRYQVRLFPLSFHYLGSAKL